MHDIDATLDPLRINISGLNILRNIHKTNIHTNKNFISKEIIGKCMDDKTDIRSIRGGKREIGWLFAWVDSSWKGGGRRENAGERKSRF